MAKTYEKTDRLQAITDKVIAALESGVKPWVKPWDVAKGASADPYSMYSGKTYRGSNLLLLGHLSPHNDPRWCTFRQSRLLGFSVRKGETGTPVFFFSPHKIDSKTKTNPDGSPKQEVIPIIKTSTAFNVNQLQNAENEIPPLTLPDPAKTPWRTPESVNEIIKTSGIEVRYGGSVASWSPSLDIIKMPHISDFHSIDGHNATLLHEFSHSTGHPSRLARDFGKRYGDKKYSAEELVAELSSVFICSSLGLNYDLEHHASYLGHFADLLKTKDGDTKNVLWKASSAAQAACDYVLLNWCPSYAAAHAAKMAEELAAELDGEDSPEQEPTTTTHAVLMPTTSAELKPYEYYDNGQLTTIHVQHLPGDRVKNELGMQGTVESIMRRGEAVEVRWDGVGSRADVVGAASLTQIAPAPKPTMTAGADATDGKGHVGVIVSAQSAPAVAWADGTKARPLADSPHIIPSPSPTPNQSAEDAEDAAMAARIVAAASARTTTTTRTATKQSSFDF